MLIARAQQGRAGSIVAAVCLVAIASAATRAPRTARPRPNDCTLQPGWKKDFVPAETRDYGRTRLTDGRLYRVSIKAPDDPPPMGKIHEWILHIEDTTGVAVDSATICIDGGMPEHGHGLPTAPKLTGPPANGDYRIEGMKFSMPGWWVVKFVIQARPGTDSVRFNLSLR
jgi:YtkA-like protein